MEDPPKMTITEDKTYKPGTIWHNARAGKLIKPMLTTLDVEYKPGKGHIAINCPFHGGSNYKCHIYTPDLAPGKCTRANFRCWSENCQDNNGVSNGLICLLQKLRGDENVGATFNWIKKFHSVEPTAPVVSRYEPSVSGDSLFDNLGSALPFIQASKKITIVQSNSVFARLKNSGSLNVVQTDTFTHAHKMQINRLGIYEVFYQGDYMFCTYLEDVLRAYAYTLHKIPEVDANEQQRF
jgi:hypothetical protein